MSGELHQISLAIGELRADMASAKDARVEILETLHGIKSDIADLKNKEAHRKGVIVGLSMLGGGSGAAIVAYMARKLGITL